MGDLDGLVWYIDPVAACLLGILIVALGAMLFAEKTLIIRVVRRTDPPWCDRCGIYHDASMPHIGEKETTHAA